MSLSRRDSTSHNSDRATANWQTSKSKVKAISFFSRHITDKIHRREALQRFMNKMKHQKEEDSPELQKALDEYGSSSDTIITGRPKSPQTYEKRIPYPEVPTYIRYEVPPGSTCALCNEPIACFREHEACPCRVCDDVFHYTCLESCGDLTETDKNNIDMALSNIGWSCPKCANISLLLTTDEVKKMTDLFEKIDFDQDSKITLKEYLLHNSRRPSLTNRRGMLLPAEEKRLSQEFQYMDHNADGRLDWWEFVNHESKTYLAQKDPYELVSHLTQKELCAAKATFNILDKDGDGHVKTYEAKHAFKTWFKQFEKRRPSLIETAASRESSSLDLHATVFTEETMSADKTCTGTIGWEDFVLHQALYILCARPNIQINTQH